MKVLLTSLEDPASLNIRDRLLEEARWEEIGSFMDRPVRLGNGFLLMEKEGTHLYFEGVDTSISTFLKDELGIDPSGGSEYPLELLIFLSRHRSEKDVRSLTVHPPGNYLNADFGGIEGFLPPSAPRVMTSALRSLYQSKRSMGIKDQTTYEVTHHGPGLNSPSFFIEIGSSADRWAIPELGRAIALGLLSMEGDTSEDEKPIAIGVGGGHYAPRFTDRAMRNKFDFGHMVPDYILSSTEDVEGSIRIAAEATPGATHVFVHWSDRNRELLRNIDEIVNSLGLVLSNPS